MIFREIEMMYFFLFYKAETRFNETFFPVFDRSVTFGFVLAAYISKNETRFICDLKI